MLLGQVERAYRGVPGVVLTASAGSTSAAPETRRFLLALHDGIVSAEEFMSSGPRGALLVAREGTPTYMRAAGTACWRSLPDSTKRTILKSLNTPAGSLRRLERSNPMTLLNVGYWFPDEGKTLTLPTKTTPAELEIETHDAFWFLAGSANPARLAPKSFLTITPNPRTHRIEEIQVRAPEQAVRATLEVTPLTRTPSIPQPQPTC
jgi:hypothetical protein